MAVSVCKQLHILYLAILTTALGGRSVQCSYCTWGTEAVREQLKRAFLCYMHKMKAILFLISTTPPCPPPTVFSQIADHI